VRTSVSYVTQIRVGGKDELQTDNDTHQRASAIRVDFKIDPTAGSVACDWYVRMPPLRGLVYIVEYLLSTMRAALSCNH
jgi:hypothetical protein